MTWFFTLLAVLLPLLFLGVAALVAYCKSLTRVSNYAPRLPRGRRMSAVTEVMSKGGFPAEAQAPHSIIHLMMLMEKLPTVAETVVTLKERFLSRPAFSRFLSTISLDPSDPLHKPAAWSDPIPLDQFEVEKHIVTIDVSSEEEIREHVERLVNLNVPARNAGDPCDFSRPPWEWYLLRNSNGRSAMVPRIHHSIGDGLALLGLALQLFTDKDGKALQLPHFNPRGGAKKQKLSAADIANKVLVMVRKGIETIIDSAKASAGFRDSKTGLQEEYPPFRWNTGIRRFILSPEWDLEELKEIKNAVPGATINDVLMSMLAGGSRRYLEYIKDPALTDPNLLVRTVMPFSFPRPVQIADEPVDAMHNLWTLVPMRLPVELPSSVSPLERLSRSAAITAYMKDSPAAFIIFGLVNIARNLLPVEEQLKTAEKVLTAHSFCFTNVPGPVSPAYFAGYPIAELRGAFANLNLMVAALSFNGKVNMTFSLNDKVIREPKRMADFVHEEFLALRAAARDSKKNSMN